MQLQYVIAHTVFHCLCLPLFALTSDPYRFLCVCVCVLIMSGINMDFGRTSSPHGDRCEVIVRVRGRV